MAVKPFLGVIKNSVPSEFSKKDIDLSPPDIGLELEYVHGYRCFDTRNNIRYLDYNNIIFHTAAVNVVMSISDNS